MKLLNFDIINVHDVVIMAAIAIIAHYTLKPIYNKIAQRDV